MFPAKVHKRRGSRAAKQATRLHCVKATHLDWTRLLVPIPLASHTLTSGSLSDRASRTAGSTRTLSWASHVAIGHATCHTASVTGLRWAHYAPRRLHSIRKLDLIRVLLVSTNVRRIRHTNVFLFCLVFFCMD